MALHKITYAPLTDTCVKHNDIRTNTKDELRGFSPLIAGQQKTGMDTDYKDNCVLPLEATNTLGMNDLACFMVKRPSIYKPSPEHIGVISLKGRLQRKYNDNEDPTFQNGCEVTQLPVTANEINYSLNWAEKQEQDRLELRIDDWNKRINILNREIADLSNRLSSLRSYNTTKDSRLDSHRSGIENYKIITPRLEKEYNSRILKYRTDRDTYNKNVDTLNRLVADCKNKMHFVTVFAGENFEGYNTVYRNPQGVIERTGVKARSIVIPPHYEVIVENRTNVFGERVLKTATYLSTEENVATENSLPNNKGFMYDGPEKYVKLTINKKGDYENTYQKITD